MRIRKATIKDIPIIEEITKIHYFTDPNSTKKTGFFNFMPSIKHYINLINRSPYCLIAEGEDGNIEGFVTAADDKKILYLSSLEKDVVLEKMLTFDKPFIYIEQIAPKSLNIFLGAKVVTSLMRRLLELSSSNNIQSMLGVIMYSPWRNIASENFAKKFGFKEVGKINNPREGILSIFQKTPKKSQ